MGMARTEQPAPHRTPRETGKKGAGLDIENGPTKYVDRPANEGKHEDAAEEPNEGVPSSYDDAKDLPKTPE
jgi:hypothetical protein